MSLDSLPQERASSPSDAKLHMRVMKTRHDLHNSIGHVLGLDAMARLS